MIRRILGLALCLAMLAGLLAVPAAAATNAFEKTDNIAQNMVNAALAQKGKKNADFSGMPQNHWNAYFIIWLSQNSGAGEADILPDQYTGFGTVGKLADGALDLGKSTLTCFRQKSYDYMVDTYGSKHKTMGDRKNFVPQPGDILFLRWTNSTASFASHAALVYKVTDTKVYYIDGNGSAEAGEAAFYTRSYVDTHSMDRTDEQIVAYLRPDYGNTAQAPESSVQVTVDSTTNCRYNITVPAGYKLQGYETPTSTANYRKIDAQDTAYRLNCIKKLELSDGSTRYYFIDGSGYGIYFVYNSKMSVSVLHDYAKTWVEPACTEEGYWLNTCTCGTSYESGHTAPLGHSWGEGQVTLEPTETTQGEVLFACTLCQETKTEILPVVHDHSWDEGRVTLEPTETAEGEKIFTCTFCQQTRVEVLPVLHVHSYTDVVTAPTCTEGGYTTHTCPCGDSYTDTEVAALGHSWDEGQVTLEPGDDTPGEKTFTCGVCQETKTQSIPELNHVHSYTDAVTAPTCTEAGHTTHTCPCGDSYTDTEVAALGHSYEKGLCTRCGAEDPDYTAPELLRLAGDHRFDTAFLAADQMKKTLGVEKFDTVVVASGMDFADALSGSYLAAVKNAPILLASQVESVNELVKTYIKENLKAGGTVYILGGVNAIPASFADGLGDFTVTRLAGDNRFQTNLRVLEEAGVGDKTLLVCTGGGFADSLSASAAKLPILLVYGKELLPEQQAFLEANQGRNLCIIGGTGAVQEAMEAQLGSYGTVERLAGADRFDTSVMIARRFFSQSAAAVLAYGANFPDGLCGGPLAAAMNAPLILTMAQFPQQAEAYVQGQDIRNGIVLGGEKLIPQTTAEAIFGCIE